MKIEVTVIVAVVGVILSVLTYFAGKQRNNAADVEKRARFEGEIKAKLDQLLLSVEKLEAKLTRNTGELHEEIKLQITEHERRYHNLTAPTK